MWWDDPEAVTIWKFQTKGFHWISMNFNDFGPIKRKPLIDTRCNEASYLNDWRSRIPFSCFIHVTYQQKLTEVQKGCICRKS